MRVRGRARALAAAGVLAVCAPGALAAFSWELSVGAGVQLNDNLFLEPSTPDDPERRQPVDETIVTFVPAVAAEWNVGVDRLRLDYRGEHWQFEGDAQLAPRWLHALAADAAWRRWAPFFLEAREIRGLTPRSVNREGEAVLEQVDWNLATLRTGLAWDFGPRGVMEFAYRGELETFPGVEDADRLQRQSGEGLVRYRWSPLWAGEALLSYGRLDRDLSPDAAELRALAIVDQNWSPLVGLRYRLGLVRTVTEEPEVDPVAPEEPVGTVSNDVLKGIELHGGLLHGGSWSLAYADTQEDRPSGDTLTIGRASAALDLHARLGSALRAGGWHESRKYRLSGRRERAWGPTLEARWMIAPWAAFDLGARWTKTVGRQEGLAELVERTTRAAAGVTLLFLRRLQFEAGYSYGNNDASDELLSYDNELFYAFATFHFQPVFFDRLPPSRVSLPISTSGETPDRLGL